MTYMGSMQHAMFLVIVLLTGSLYASEQPQPNTQPSVPKIRTFLCHVRACHEESEQLHVPTSCFDNWLSQMLRNEGTSATRNRSFLQCAHTLNGEQKIQMLNCLAEMQSAYDKSMRD